MKFTSDIKYQLCLANMEALNPDGTLRVKIKLSTEDAEEFKTLLYHIQEILSSV